MIICGRLYLLEGMYIIYFCSQFYLVAIRTSINSAGPSQQTLLPVLFIASIIVLVIDIAEYI
jgi:hypothetical protein